MMMMEEKKEQNRTEFGVFSSSQQCTFPALRTFRWKRNMKHMASSFIIKRNT